MGQRDKLTMVQTNQKLALFVRICRVETLPSVIYDARMEVEKLLWYK
jgi:hypothetical protein